MITNADITIYHETYNKETRLKEWTSRQYPGVNWYGKQAVSVGDTGLNTADSYIVRIPTEETIVISNGDLVVKGLVTDQITGPSQLTGKYECFVVIRFRKQGGSKMKIIQNLADPSRYSIKCPYAMTPTRVVVHNTANDAPAANEIAYMIRNDNEVSFHYAVDDQEVVQGVPENRNTWNAGDGNGKGNREGIAVEICYSLSGGEKFTKAEQNAAEFIASILKRYGWGMDRVTKHQDYNGKYCPHRTLDLGWDRFLKMVEAHLNGDKPAPSPTPAPAPEPAKTVDVYYRVRTKADGWLPEVKNLEDYAGFTGAVTDVAVRVSAGSVKYRVHIKGGNWLPYVTGCNINDAVNGYAGNGLEIDAVEVYYYTPDSIRPYKKAKYRVAPVGGSYYPWQYDNETGNGQDGYAGAFGNAIGKLQIVIE